MSLWPIAAPAFVVGVFVGWYLRGVAAWLRTKCSSVFKRKEK